MSTNMLDGRSHDARSHEGVPGVPAYPLDFGGTAVVAGTLLVGTPGAGSLVSKRLCPRAGNIVSMAAFILGPIGTYTFDVLVNGVAITGSPFAFDTAGAGPQIAVPITPKAVVPSDAVEVRMASSPGPADVAASLMAVS